MAVELRCTVARGVGGGERVVTNGCALVVVWDLGCCTSVVKSEWENQHGKSDDESTPRRFMQQATAVRYEQNGRQPWIVVNKKIGKECKIQS
jgi:hypothetical protein